MMTCYYDVLPQGLAFMSSYRTFVFSEDPNKLVRGTEMQKSISCILHGINCEELIENYHEMMMSEKYIIDTLESYGIRMVRKYDLGGCRGEEAA